jgi:hypothetical protein
MQPCGVGSPRGAATCSALCVLFAGMFAATAATTEPATSVFGPRKFVRATGAPRTETERFTIPSGSTGPFTLVITNGEADGRNRVSSATVTLNGVTIARQSDFNQNVREIRRTVTLVASNVLQVELQSLVGSYIFINVNGVQENRAPTVNAGPDLSVELPGSVTLNGSVSDDGLPVPPRLTTTWSKVSGPGTVTFGNPSTPVTTALF